MHIENKKVVSLNYTLSVKAEGATQEEVFEQTSAAQPFIFLFGAGSLIPDFEMNLKGKVAGDKFDFRISADKGYGLRDTQNVVNIPIDAFKAPDGTLDLNQLKIGNILPMRDQQGNQFEGAVAGITSEHVTMDFNHELAGHDLHFSGEVLAVRAATAEELDHGHVHGPGGHHHH